MEGNDEDDLYGDLLTGQAEEGQGHYRAEAEEVRRLRYTAVFQDVINSDVCLVGTDNNVYMCSSKASCRQRNSKCSSYRSHLTSHRQR